MACFGISHVASNIRVARSRKNSVDQSLDGNCKLHDYPVRVNVKILAPPSALGETVGVEKF
jgi:hypothetical protein